MFVTASTFKQLAVTNVDGGDTPIFLGPVFLHGNSTFETYATFFNALAVQLADVDTKRLVIDYDDEKALRKAIKHAFPFAKYVLCSRHLKNNVNDYLSEKVGIQRKDRKAIIERIFGPTGVANSDDTITFEERSELFKEDCKVTAPKFISYLDNRLLPLIEESLCPQKDGLVQPNWTNNNCESINHVIKQLEITIIDRNHRNITVQTCMFLRSTKI